ncbi:MAG: hypothetical protein AAFU85_04555 [Planctomycetota bacterium]
MLEHLKELVHPPRQPMLVPPYIGRPRGSIRTWEEAEEILGLSFPDEHKQVVDCYGDGIWGASLVLIAPRFCNQYCNTLEIVTGSHLFRPHAAPLSDDAVYLEAFNGLQGAARTIHEASPIAFYPSSPGLLPLGYLGDNYLGLDRHGVYLFWSTSEEQEILVLSRDFTFRRYPLGLCNFLVRAFQGSVDLGETFNATCGFKSRWMRSGGNEITE